MCNENRFDQMKGEISSLAISKNFSNCCEIVRLGKVTPEVAEYAHGALVEAGEEQLARILNDFYEDDLAILSQDIKAGKVPEGGYTPKPVCSFFN